MVKKLTLSQQLPSQLPPILQPKSIVSEFEGKDFESFLREIQQKPKSTTIINPAQPTMPGKSWYTSLKHFLLKFLPKRFS